MSFQFVIDHAEQISMDRRKLVASTSSRDGLTRTVSRGAQVWKFTVKLPDGLPWSGIRQDISKLEAMDMITNGTFKLSDTGHDWIVEYQGNATLPQSFTGTWAANSYTVTITSGGGTISSGYKFRAGDFIQLGSSGNVYTVAADCAYNSNSVTLHRPAVTSGSGSIAVAENCTWTVKCIQMPKWTLMARDQVSWDGEFIFQEVV